MKTNLGPPRYYRCVCVKHPLGFIGGPTWYEETDDPNAETRIVIAEKTMTAETLASLVAEMRHAQKEYFRTRSTSALEESKRLEAKVDRCVDRILDEQTTLFD